jgi:hypothetical protein
VVVPVEIEPAPIVGRELPPPPGLVQRTIDGRELPVREV